jgi:hypothetical protein
MILADVIYEVRDMLNDEDATNGYRFSEKKLSQYVEDGINEIRRVRSDSYMDENGELKTFDGCWKYTETGGNDSYTSGYNRIDGWDRLTYTTLYFKAKTAAQIEIYFSSASRTTGTTPEALVNNCDSTGWKRVESANTANFEGSIYVGDTLVVDNTWEAKAIDQDLSIDDMFFDALVNWVCYKAFLRDSEDTLNAQRSQVHLQTYKSLIGDA